MKKYFCLLLISAFFAVSLEAADRPMFVVPVFKMKWGPSAPTTPVEPRPSAHFSHSALFESGKKWGTGEWAVVGAVVVVVVVIVAASSSHHGGSGGGGGGGY